MKVIDLTLPLNNQTVTCPGDPCISISKVLDFDKDNVNVTELKMGTHSGTHVDLPLHHLKDGCDAEMMNPDKFFGEAYAVCVKYNMEPIIDFEINPMMVKPNDILLFHTGWDRFAGTPDFFKGFPFFSDNLIDQCIRLGIKAIGTDLPSADSFDSGGCAHRRLLNEGIVIFEALANLKQLDGKRFTFYGFPLKITNGDGSPIRAVAILD